MPLKPIATNHPSIPNATWTRVNTSRNAKRRITLVNEDPSNQFSFIKVAVGASVAGLTSSDGLPLDPGGGSLTGGIYETPPGMTEKSDVYAYQASGGALTTLGVFEEQDERSHV
jgi:hypothetical protein